MSLPSVLLNKTNGQILARAPYPRADMGPVEDLHPDLEWCVIRTPFPAPDFDPRYFSLVQTEARGPDPDTEFPHLHPWLITFTTEKRPTPEIITSIENKEREQLNRHVREVEALKLSLLGLAVLFRKTDGLQLTAREQAIANRVIAAAVKVWQNHDRAAEIANQVTAGQEPDLEAGWATPAA